MKIFITGATGFIGSNLKNYFLSQGHIVYLWNRNIDISESLNKSEPNLIINCAAEIYSPESMFDVNVGVVNQILTYLLGHKSTQFIQLGSSSEYGPHDKPTVETDLVNPQDCYSATKSSATLLCRAWAKKYELDVVVVRPYSPYGPGEKSHRLFPKLVRSFLFNEPMKLVEGVHDFCYIDDFVDAIDLIVKSGQRVPGEIINVSYGKQYTNSEVLEIFKRVSGSSGNVDMNLTVFSTPSVWCSDSSIAKTKYSWQPKFDLEAGIRDFLLKAQHE